MKTRILAALLCSASLAGAQTRPQGGAAPDPTDPQAAVPRAAYRSVFADTPRGVESGTTA